MGTRPSTPSAQETGKLSVHIAKQRQRATFPQSRAFASSRLVC